MHREDPGHDGRRFAVVVAMRFLVVVIACLAVVILTLALPWESSPQIRAGRIRAIEDAVGKLSDESHDARRRAANLLVSMGEEAKEPLLTVHACTDAEVRRRAAEILRAVEAARADPGERLQRQYVTVISVALDAPGELRPGSDRFEALGLDPERATQAALEVAAASERRPDRHERVVTLLCDLGRPSAAGYLAELLVRGTFPPSLLHRAAEGLIEFGGPEILPEVRDAVRGHEEWARKQALRVLGRLGASSDAKLARALCLDPCPSVREAATAALSAVAGRRASDDLRSLAGDPDSGVRAAALAELSRLDLPASAELAAAALADPSPRVREAALNALAATADPSRGAEIEALRGDPSARVRAAVVRGLAAIDQAESAVHFGAFDRSPIVRREALLASRRLPSDRRRELLDPEAGEPDPYLAKLRRTLLTAAEAH